MQDGFSQALVQISFRLVCITISLYLRFFQRLVISLSSLKDLIEIRETQYKQRLRVALSLLDTTVLFRVCYWLGESFCMGHLA